MDIEFYNKLNQALHGDAGKIDRVMRFRYLNEFVKPGQILFACLLYTSPSPRD